MAFISLGDVSGGASPAVRGSAHKSTVRAPGFWMWSLGAVIGSVPGSASCAGRNHHAAKTPQNPSQQGKCHPIRRTCLCFFLLKILDFHWATKVRAMTRQVLSCFRYSISCRAPKVPPMLFQNSLLLLVSQKYDSLFSLIVRLHFPKLTRAILPKC
jgi:hypothetical protein